MTNIKTQNRHVTHLMFYIFGILHTLSYTVAILAGLNLDYERAIYGLLLILLYYKYLNQYAIYFNVAVLYIAIFTAFYTVDIGTHIKDVAGFILYYNITLIYWKIVCEEQSDENIRLHKLYLYISLPLLIYLIPLIVTPSQITFDFYTNPALERLGLKSRTVGWAAACCIPLLFELTKREGLMRTVAYGLTLLFLFIVVGSGSRSSMIGVSIFTVIAILRSHTKYKITWAITTFILSLFIISNSEKLAITRREQLHTAGVSDDSYRWDMVTHYISHLYNDFPQSIFPAGFGEPNVLHTLNSFFDTEGFGAHNSYITVIVSMGFFALLFFMKYLKGIRYLVSKKQFISYMPFLVISFTEDAFGPGQFLFMFFIAIFVVTAK